MSNIELQGFYLELSDHYYYYILIDCLCTELKISKEKVEHAGNQTRVSSVSSTDANPYTTAEICNVQLMTFYIFIF